MKKKERVNVSPEQKLEYCKLMVEDGFTNAQIQEMSGASSSAITRWKTNYRRELEGETPQDKKAITPEQQKIQSLEKQLREAQKDNELLKKAAAFFIRDNNALR